MMILLSSATGNVVSAYTGSPSLAVFVEIACLSDKATLVPAGITVAAGSGLLATDAGCASLLGGGAEFCAIAHIPRTSAPIPNIVHRIDIPQTSSSRTR